MDLLGGTGSGPMLSGLAVYDRVQGINRVRLELQQVYESCRSLGQRLQWWMTSVWARNRAQFLVQLV